MRGLFFEGSRHIDFRQMSISPRQTPAFIYTMSLRSCSDKSEFCLHLLLDCNVYFGMSRPCVLRDADVLCFLLKMSAV